MRRHRFFSVLMASVLAAALLAGCGSGPDAGDGAGTGSKDPLEENSGAPAAGPNGGASGSAASGGASNFADGQTLGGGEIPLGRYVEEEIALPDSTYEYQYTTMIKGKDGRLELYMHEGGPMQSVRYLYDGSSWQMDQEWKDWYSAKLSAGEICGEPSKITFGQDGRYYFTAMDEEYICHLYRADDDGGVTELLADAFLPPAGRPYGLIPTQIDVTEDGRILIHDMDYVYCYRPDGARLFDMARFPGASDSSTGYVDGNEFLTVTEQGVTRYDLSAGEKIEDIDFDETVGDTQLGTDNKLFGDESGIYLASRKGLFHVNRGGTLWEQIMDGSLNSMGRESRYLNAFCSGSGDDFYGCYTSSGGQAVTVCHYTYDPQMPSVPSYTLTVYSLSDNATVREAASIFQDQRPDVFVDVRCATEEESRTVSISEDTIRALNTEILNGKGADVLVLDGLPAASYQAKGVLMDMRGLFAEIQEEDPLLSQVAADFTQADGAIYQMPARIEIPIVVGTAEAAAAWQSLEGIRDYQSEKPLQWADVYEGLLRTVAVLYYPELFGEDGSSFDRERLAVCLEAVKALGESCGAKISFTEQEQEELHISNRVPPMGIKGNEYFYDAGLSDSGLDVMTRVSDFGFPQTFIRNHPDTAVELINGGYFPSGLIGINQATAEAELAQEFVKCIFSLDVQKENLYDGFPVSEAGLDAQFAAADGNDTFAYSMGFPGWDYTADGGYPDEENRARLRGLIEDASRMVNVDQTLLGMVVQNALDYCEDKISAEQAVSAIEQQVMLYQAEKD